MKGIRISRNRVNYFILPIVFSMFSLVSGCMPGTIETAVGTGIIYEQKQKYAYQHEVEAKVDEYIRDHADSPCRNGEDRVIDSAVEIIKTYRLSGFNEVLERLDTLYRDPAQPRASVRPPSTTWLCCTPAGVARTLCWHGNTSSACTWSSRTTTAASLPTPNGATP